MDGSGSILRDDNGRFLAPATFNHNYDVLTESIKDLLPATLLSKQKSF